MNRLGIKVISLSKAFDMSIAAGKKGKKKHTKLIKWAGTAMAWIKILLL